MKKILIITTALLLIWGCSKNDDDDSSDKIFQTDAQSLDSTDTISIDANEKEEKESETKLSDEEIQEIKDKIAALEEAATKSIKLKFINQGDSLKAEIGMRCETTDVEKLKGCLGLIKAELETFMQAADKVLGDAEDSSLREEYAKVALSTKWLSKINKNIRMVR